MIRLAVLFACFATPTMALDLSLPGATLGKIDTQAAASTRLPTEPWTPGAVPKATDGAIRRSVLQSQNTALTTLQMLAPLRDRLEADGYTTVFTCADAACGGFDFRFQLDLIGEPDMHVDLGNYRYLLMQNPTGEPHTIALVASPGSTGGYIHVTEVFDAALPQTEPTPEPQNVPAIPTRSGALSEVLITSGRVVLDDLEFGTGSADLGDGPFATLAELAVWLAANPSARIVLVGHTDAVGSLEANTSLSRRRASAVADRLVAAFGVSPGQLQSAGAGFLASVASNLTAEGRAANRRVEVVLLALE